MGNWKKTKYRTTIVLEGDVRLTDHYATREEQDRVYKNFIEGLEKDSVQYNNNRIINFSKVLYIYKEDQSE